MFSNTGQGGSSTPRRSARGSRRPGSSRAGSVSNVSPTPSAASTLPAFARQSPAPSSRRQASVLTVSDAMSMSDSKNAEKVLVRDQNYVVKERQRLPVEVERLIAASDAYTDPVKASLDPVTGFAFALDKQTCLLWNYFSAATSTTIYSFPCPPVSNLAPTFKTFVPLSFACIVPASVSPATREPGLVMCSPTGELCFWDRISLALTSVDRFSDADIRLNDKEVVKDAKLAPNNTCVILSTNQSRLFLVFLSQSRLFVRTIERPSSWGIWNAVFGSSKSIDPRAGYVALSCSSTRDDRILYALTQRQLQVWRLPVDQASNERLVAEHDVFAAILHALFGQKVGNDQWALNERKVDLLDAVVAKDGTLAVLISYVPPAQTSTNILSYAIVRLEVGTSQDAITPAGITHLSFSAPTDPRPFASPRLISPDRDLAFVVFPEAVVLLSLSASFEEAFSLKAGMNRFLGVSSPSTAPSRSISLLTSTPSVINVALLSTIPLAVGASSSKTGRLQHKIEQAIYYGSRDAQNPLAFEIRDQDGDLAAACENVSSDILASASPSLPPILDLRVQLADRIARARALIELVGASGLLGKLSQNARRILSSDADKLAAAAALWQHQNSQSGGDNLLVSAIQSFAAENGDLMAEDVIRAFFRTQVAALGSVLEQIGRITRGLVDQASRNEEKMKTLTAGSRLLLLALDAVEAHRKETAKLYALESTIPIEPWTSTPALLEIMTWHFNTTDSLVTDRVVEGGAAGARKRVAPGLQANEQQNAQEELKAQMCSLAGHLFASYEQRLQFLRSVNVDGSSSAELKVLPERYSSLRPTVLHALVQIGRVAEAYALAEKHRHFEYRSLVELATNATHGSPSKVRAYLDKYRDGFAFALFQYLVEKGQVRTLMDQNDDYRIMLTQFLDATDNPRISWINDLYIQRYDSATRSLVGEALKEHRLAQKKLMLSIGKLCQVAQVSHDTLHSEGAQKAIEAVDDNIDLVNSQADLKQAFLEALPTGEARGASVSRQAETVASRLATSLQGRPALREHFVRACAELLDDKALEAEDLVDLLTLKDNHDEASVGDYGSALECFVRARHMPSRRKSVVLQSVWRRIYLHDDWQALREASQGTNMNDDQVKDAIKSTALFVTLARLRDAQLHPFSATDDDGDNEQVCFVGPSEAVWNGSASDLAQARFGNATPLNVVEAVQRDFEAESGRLEEFIQQADLDAFVAEAMRLVKEDAQNDDNDFEMNM